MATPHEIIGEEWVNRAGELADWALERLVNRKDIWGQYAVLTEGERKSSGKGYKAMTLPQVSMRDGSDHVTIDKLTRHFSSRHYRRPQLIGLHAKSEDSTSKWFGIDIDMHELDKTTAEEHARRNLVGALEWVDQLQGMGYDPLLFDSSGRGGLHLWVLLAEPAPTEDVFALAYSLVSQWRERSLDEEPETFPKKPKKGSIGAWFRLPGLHPVQEHYARVWSGDEWLENPWLQGDAAIDAMLSAVPGPPPPKADPDAVYGSRTTRFSVGHVEDKPKPTPKAATRKRGFKRKGKATVCVDLDGVLHRPDGGGLDELGEPIDGAVDFTRTLSETAEVIILTARLSKGTAKRRKEIEEAIRQWLDANGFAYAKIHNGPGKPPAQAYIDDRGVACRPMDDGVKAFKTALQATDDLLG